MSIEIGRETSVRKIYAPDDKQTFVKLKVIDKIRFIDPTEQYQEYEYSFENNSQAQRSVEIATVGEAKLQVERIRNLNLTIKENQYQEVLYELLANPNAHKKTHTAKIYATDPATGEKDKSTWIKVERIDEIGFFDPKSQYQEAVFSLNWPDIDNPEWDYQDLSPIETADDDSAINPPWRIDPFQNIVDAHFGGIDYIIIEYHWDVGLNLTIRNKVIQPISATLGYLVSSSAGNIIFWGGDNFGYAPLAESILIDKKEADKYLSDIVMELRAYWASTFEQTTASFPVTIKITTSKGGTVEVNNGLYEPVNYQTKKTQVLAIKTITDIGALYEGYNSEEEFPGQYILTLTVHRNSGKWTISQ